MSSKDIRIEVKRIEAVKQWPEPQSVQNIQVFLGFANFYRQFIQGFRRIAAPLTLMLKTLGGTESKTRHGEGRVGADSDIRARRGRSEIGGIRTDNVEVDRGEVEVDEVEKKVQNLSKFKKTVRSSDFFTSKAKLAFTKLRQAFFKAPIFYHFDLEYHIWIETNVSCYAIGGVLSQLNLDDLVRWHPIAFFSRKMIPAETIYETHNGELLKSHP